ncbi:methyltransferase domain-containing protein [Spirilliplanes yamanashiensis]|uniref:SAM-dependent methyltransferase n=1 Tax=Spirilliplanes yamanashiensis TaxID=42233 RepID=A0A8J3YBN2_9ACTN|nr:class I SAM-dependent methyltransferase [Spirilliplanes yamanashiensis]MDP9818189.1 SAM-dependent methyltransferase [Spirilliplanes yamanashiensis]GIJ05000.1 SAM-dependent methyltransferase [Spirilliplanes yamanashiensis]
MTGRPGGGPVFRATVRPLLVLGRWLLVEIQERRYGIRTSGEVELADLGLAAADRRSYKPSPWLGLRRALPRRSVSPDDVFIDIGSGRGRVVFQAARFYAFRRVIGVELSPQLHAEAVANIERNRASLRCAEVRLYCGDVLDVPIPDDVTVAYLYNPFAGAVFATVAGRLLASVDRRPRRLRIVYANPVEHDLLMATGRVRLTGRVRALRPGREWAASASVHVYDVTPAGSAAVTGPA